jgi:hypothetical protein
VWVLTDEAIHDELHTPCISVEIHGLAEVQHFVLFVKEDRCQLRKLLG